MDNRYQIDFSADLTPGISLLQQAIQNSRANKRSNAYLDMERDAVKQRADRESAAVKRQQAEDERRHAIEDFAARPGLRRMAFQEGAGAANANPYGVQFSETHDLPANVEGPEMSPAAEESRFNPKPPAEQEFHVPEQPPVGALNASEEGPEVNPAASAARYMLQGPQAAPRALDPGEEGPQQEQPQALPIMAQAAASARGMDLAPGPEGQRRMFESVGGAQPHELHERGSTTPFGEKYDRMFAALRDQLGDEAAIKEVAHEYRNEQENIARDKRLTDAIGGRNANREDQQNFTREENEKYKETHKGRMELVDEAGKFKVAAAGPGSKADAGNARDMSLLERAGSAIRQTGQFAKLAASDKTVRGLMMNIANGTTPLQHKDAQIQLARFFRQAQPTEGEMHMLYNNLGGTMDKWNQFVARLETGDLSSEQMRQLKASAKGVRKEHEEDLRRFISLSRARLGPGGGFDLMPDQAQRLFESMAAELGLEGLPPLYDVTGGVTLGSGKRPTVQPRGKKKTALDDIESQLDAMGAGNGR